MSLRKGGVFHHPANLMKITVVIPNYNGMDGLKILLPQLVREDIFCVYVVDDNSTDQSVEYVKTFPKIIVIEGNKNIGPAGNRNRVLKEENLGEFLWFVDADMELITTKIGNVVEKLFGDPRVAVVGGLIVNKEKNSPYYWNYGYEMHPLRDRLAEFYGNFAKKFEKRKKVHDLIRRIAIHYFYGLEIDAGNHQERVVEWVAEGNFLVRTNVFKKIGGFDERMRYHESHDFGKRIRQLGFIIKFSPEIVTRHLEIECREGLKTQDWLKGRKYFFGKHWGNPQKALKNFFRLGM